MVKKEENKEMCLANSLLVAGCANILPHGTLVISRTWIRKEMVQGQTRTSRIENGMMSLNTMLLNFSESGHPVFRGTSALERGTLRKQRSGQFSLHFSGDPQTVQVVFRNIISVSQHSIYGAVAENFLFLCGDPETVELVFRTLSSVNQLSIHGAVADMCEEFASRISDCSVNTEKLVAEDKPETMVSPTDLSTTTNPLLTNDQARGNVLREYKQRFANIPDDLRRIKVCSRCRFHEDCRSRTAFCDQRRSGTGKIGFSWFMSRIHITSR